MEIKNPILKDRKEIFKGKNSKFDYQIATLLSGKLLCGDIILRESDAYLIDKITYSKVTGNFMFHCYQLRSRDVTFNCLNKIKISINKRFNALVIQLNNK